VSSTTWTRTAVGSSAAPVGLAAWRAVEAQHRVSTIRLVDTLEEQGELEQLLDGSKPDLPATPAGLHWLLTTPFRYPPLPQGSRFRGPADPGVFYGADTRRTACAELGFWRWRFLLDSPALAALDALPQTLFTAHIEALAVDLRQMPLLKHAAIWTDPHHYAPCQAFARQARDAGVLAIRYASVRDPSQGGCVAVLSPLAFVPGELNEQAWRLTVTPSRVFWHRDSALHAETFEFETAPWHGAAPA
jgi:hypothetical protein